MQDITTFITELEKRVAPLEDEYCEVYWEFANTGNAELQGRLVELELEFHRIFSDSADFERVKGWRSAGGHDAETARIIELLYFGYLSKQEPEELARRKAKWKAPKPKYKTGVLAKYAALVRDASHGAVTD